MMVSFVALLALGVVTSEAAHYGMPLGCSPDETQVQLSYHGELCAPSCGNDVSSKCPQDIPLEVSAEPKCALKDVSGNKYCALTCSKDAECGSQAKCAKVNSLLGICVYTSTGTATTEVEPSAPAPTVDDDKVEPLWARFKKDFNRTYSDVEEPRRFKAFGLNVLRAYALNLEQGIDCKCLYDDENCVFGITKFSDMFEDEFASTMLGYRPPTEHIDAPVLSMDDLPMAADTVDWRTKGAVTPVKDQGQCGSCWAFSTTEEIESSIFMATGKLETLSTQQIISCDKVDEGCNGGNTETAYKYVQKAGGLDTASDYPDKSHNSGRTGKCTWDKKSAAKVSGFYYATPKCQRGSCKNQDEDKLAQALSAKGPVSICVNAGGNGWQVYKRGVFSKRCSGAADALDHCVQLVGYKKSGSFWPGSKSYWIVRNSWNTDWGVKGYMYLEMGKNLCGVADDATIADATLASEELII